MHDKASKQDPHQKDLQLSITIIGTNLLLPTIYTYFKRWRVFIGDLHNLWFVVYDEVMIEWSFEDGFMDRQRSKPGLNATVRPLIPQNQQYKQCILNKRRISDRAVVRKYIDHVNSHIYKCVWGRPTPVRVKTVSKFGLCTSAFSYWRWLLLDQSFCFV